MAKVREIRRRIKSVESTKQITRAMEMVATSKIKRAQSRIEKLRPYSEEMEKLVVALVGVTDKPSNPLTEIREVKNVAIVAITADRGLCGAFNTNIIRKCEASIKEETAAGRGIKLLTVGRKALGYFRYVGQPIAGSYTGISDLPTYGAAMGLTEELVDLYAKGEVDKVVLIYNRFVSALDQRPVEKQLLPIEKKIEEGQEELKMIQYMVEPSIEAIFPDILKSSLESIVFQALVDSAASEHAARRKAMKAATENAEEMIFNLSRSFNRARQALITQEIAEIVGGADALEHS
jgi:F-type H+-transporting ATPase subunit gamma